MFRWENNSNDNGSTPVVSSTTSTTNSPYFVGKTIQDGATSSIRDSVEVEGLPQGSYSEEFAPKMLHPRDQKNGPTSSAAATSKGGGGFWANLFSGGGGGQRGGHVAPRRHGEVGTLVKARKAPIKVEPKVFFSNERTFLAWMHVSIILAGASIAIVAISEEDADENPYGEVYGLILLPVSIAFIVYSMMQYVRRAQMIRTRQPGPFEDILGPTILGVFLMFSIVAQFALKLYSMNT